MENITEPTETDESGSLHFQAPKKDEGAPVKGRKVFFHSRIQCRTRLNKAPITSPDNLWYSKQELASLRKQNKRVKNLGMSGFTSFIGDDDTEAISFVGLYSEMERKQRAQRIKEAKKCVFGEQMQQEEDFYNGVRTLYNFKLDQESIAEFYSIYSLRAAKIAQMKGLRLARHVESLSAEECTFIDDNHRPCSQHSYSQRSKVTSENRLVRKKPSMRSVGNLIARLTTPAAA
ncbi:unnamed protein product [Cylindrotheca closterium]|uniref:Uncharacterized protein n=1 Tax=Cylindrotheca closterium TaxID=2856 RepID=A0AAD2FQD3_9STRA|nr:unnamed protein product [Cylindrotheca closterium]